MTKPGPDGIDGDFDTDPQEPEETTNDCQIRVDQDGNYVGAQAFEYVVEKVEGGLKLTRPDKISMFMRSDSINSQLL
jgi:hypothetical protein